jgi:predicted RNA-binding protein
MTRRYWLDLYTGKSWEEFLKNKARVTGFRETRRALAGKIKPGDYLLCYMTGISRFIGVLEVKSDLYIDHEKIWSDEDFPIRFRVELLQKLEPKISVPILTLKDKLTIFQNLKSENAWSGFFRGSPAEFNKADGEAIVGAIQKASHNPIERPYDEKKYWRSPHIFESKKGLISVPDEDEQDNAPLVEPATGITHEEIQWLLLKLGSDLGLDVWVARNDLNKSFNGHAFKDIPRLKSELPVRFEAAVKRIVELIDVLWLQNKTILAAFEVEHTTAIYSGLLRMADLISMQSNLRIDLYMVTPDERKDKVIAEINRPTFTGLTQPLPKMCKFIPYSKLKMEVEQIGHRIKNMKPTMIYDIAESCELEG